jgi:hypothetical protein
MLTAKKPDGLDEIGKMASEFPRPAAGEEDERLAIEREFVTSEELLARGLAPNNGSEGMADIGCVDTAFAKPGLFEGKQTEQLVDNFPEYAHPALTPSPDLRGY